MEKHIRRFTRANPGLIVFIVDQSDQMSLCAEDGRSFAEITAESINRSILEMILRFVSGTTVKDSAWVAIITHGGECDDADIYRLEKINELYKNPLRVENRKKRISDGAGGFLEIDLELPIFIEPFSKGFPHMKKAFQIAYELIDEWRKKDDKIDGYFQRDKSLDPVPLIVNLTSDDICVDDELVHIVNRIKGIELDDGNPLILNCKCTASKVVEDFTFDNTDVIASFVPQEKTDGFKRYGGYPYVDVHSMLIMYELRKLPDVIGVITMDSIPCPCCRRGEEIR